MSVKRKKTKNRLHFRPGRDLHFLDRLVAEKDEDLARYYVAEDRYVTRALDKFDPAIFFIGTKGAGKSAILQMVRLKNAESAKATIIEVTPDQIAITPLANADLSSPLLSDPGKYRWLFRSLWDFILCVEILHHEFPNEFAFLGAIKSLVRGEDENRARKLLDVSGRRGNSSQSLADRVLELVKAVEISSKEVTLKAELRDPSSKRIDASDPRSLLMLVNLVARGIPTLVDHPYYILIDDLDYQWANTPLQNAFISSLFSSLQKLSQNRNLKFVVALRKRIYRNLHLEDKDKYRQWICDVSWDFDSVKKMIQRRLSDVLNCTEKDIFGEVFPPNAFRRLYDSTTGVPREAIRLSALCIREAKMAGHNTVTESDIDSGILSFSDEKLEDIASDWDFVYPGLASLMRRFRGTQKEFSLEKLTTFAYEVGLEVHEGKNDTSQYSWVGGLWEDPKELGAILLNCSVLQLKDNKKSLPVPIDYIEKSEIPDTAWFAVSPMLAPGLRMAGT